MRKTYLGIALLVTVLGSFDSTALGATYYVDCGVGTSGNGTSWGTAWKSLSNITGLSAGDVVYVSGSATCASYSVSQWNPINGSVSNPIVYRVGQDAGHNSAVTITLSGGPGMAGTYSTLQGIWIDGNYNGTRHMTLRGGLGAAGTPTVWHGVRLSYLTMDNTEIGGGDFTNFELDHSYIDLPPNSDHFFTRSGPSSSVPGFTTNLIHDNTIRTRQSTNGSGFGDDGFQWIDDVTFYNNIFQTVFDSSQTIQHQDFIQTCGDYIDLHDNYFENPGNYAFYGDCENNVSHWHFYNNVFAEFSGHGSGISNYMMGMGYEPGFSGFTMTDIIVANNTCYQQDSSHSCVGLNPGNTGNVATSSYVENNIAYNCGFDLVPGTGGSIANSNNATGTSGIRLVNPSAYPNGDWHETSTSTATIGRGTSPSLLTSIFTTDKDGNPRPNGAWDIGAYQFGAGGSGGNPSAPTGLVAVVN